MSSLIPPMVSSSPPPLDDDDNLDDEDDDEFGDFAAADQSYEQGVETLQFPRPTPPREENGEQRLCNGDSTSRDSRMVGTLDWSLQEPSDTGQHTPTPVRRNSVGSPSSRSSLERSSAHVSSDVLTERERGSSQNTMTPSEVPSFGDINVTRSDDREHSKNKLMLAERLEIVSDVNRLCKDTLNSSLEVGILDTSDEHGCDIEPDFVDSSEGISSHHPQTIVNKEFTSSQESFDHENDFLGYQDFESIPPINDIINSKDGSPEYSVIVSEVAEDISLSKNVSCVEELEDLNEFVNTEHTGVLNSSEVGITTGRNVKASVDTELQEDLNDFRKLSSVNSMNKSVNLNLESPSKTKCKLDMEMERKENQNESFDDFGNFASVVPLNCLDVPERGDSEEDPYETEWGAFGSPKGVEEGGFAEFASPVSEEVFESRQWAAVSAAQDPALGSGLELLEEDFDDFEVAEFQSISPVQKEETGVVSARLESMLLAVFPAPQDANPCPADPEVLGRSTVWGRLRDLETSHALSYHWVGSSANKLLLAALGVDARNIVSTAQFLSLWCAEPHAVIFSRPLGCFVVIFQLFGARWNVSMPRYAANLGLSPLEPVRASEGPPIAPTGQIVATKLEDPVVPAAQFDWNGSGLVNPLDSAHSSLLHLDLSNLTSSPAGAWNLTLALEKSASRSEEGLRREGLSAEAVKILDTLPDLSFLRATLLMFPVRTDG
uniref:Aftiphilin clathrin-binding box domain-containing protein n=1 Tax=Timema tahoe TaxID=61484 RepID=A0A7R9IIL1_9NEOP|nr:unnamed protein product [Timema tahoe]